jgi:hypothetical protein
LNVLAGSKDIHIGGTATEDETEFASGAIEGYKQWHPFG